MADSAKNVEGVIPADSPIMEPPTVPLVMDMVQRSNGNGAAISIVDLVNRSDGEENVVGLIDAPNDNGSGDGDVTNGEGGHKHKSFGSVATDEAPRSKGESIYQIHICNKCIIGCTGKFQPCPACLLLCKKGPPFSPSLYKNI